MDIKLDPFVSVGLIDMYCKCDLMKDARTVYNFMPEKDLIALNAMISGHLHNGDDVEALSLFTEMYKDGIGFNQTTLLTILNSTAGLQVVNVCGQVHALSVKIGTSIDIYIVK
ncbi:Pentatricopeptide repeat-containing protein [Camellia lanceoleosa]|uniref:Pentatricopeptide repeat-containing protein n=1 Tax=Camellia lanceoleosa TaxID=1840588 RepID=A0ACC0GFY1_9ERIC|nr:Pentatricopeptide repeat-containing protein [Camellia lanceoleosa]